MKTNLKKKTKADVLSVLLEGSKSIHMYIKVGGESCNVSVRFDQGDEATICGYPRAWVLWDYQVDEFDPDSPTGSEYLDSVGGELEDGQVYVDASDEVTILKAAIRGIKRQAKDTMFKDSATSEYRIKCINACLARIKALN